MTKALIKLLHPSSSLSADEQLQFTALLIEQARKKMRKPHRNRRGGNNVDKPIVAFAVRRISKYPRFDTGLNVVAVLLQMFDAQLESQH